MPRKSAPEPNLRFWIASWLRLLAPTDRTEGVAGRLLDRLRLMATVSVLLAFIVAVWASVALIVGAAWMVLTEGQLGSAVLTLLSGAGAAAGGAYYRGRQRRRFDEDSGPEVRPGHDGE